LKHRVKVYDIDAVNVDYFQRPVKLEAKQAKLESYFAPMASSLIATKNTIEARI